ncbi:MAG: hypothetical protein OXE59_02510 [Bacteroidetes bacterium]|nr:hypothetical protein [Bacteroidota bacterium]
MRLFWNEIRARVSKFSDQWKDAMYEIEDTQSFYSAFSEIFGIQRRSVARFKQDVKKLDNRSGFIDLYYPEVLIIEQ